MIMKLLNGSNLHEKQNLNKALTTYAAILNVNQDNKMEGEKRLDLLHFMPKIVKDYGYHLHWALDGKLNSLEYPSRMLNKNSATAGEALNVSVWTTSLLSICGHYTKRWRSKILLLRKNPLKILNHSYFFITTSDINQAHNNFFVNDLNIYVKNVSEWLCSK